jgi:hypothetical protein
LNANDEIRAWLASHDCQCGVDPVPDAAPGTNKVEFQNANGDTLAARLEWPTDGSTSPKGIAIFAHCFTCSKDLPATTRAYLDRVEVLVGAPVSIIGVGPERKQRIVCGDLREWIDAS